MKLQDKVAVVTGGGRALGRAIALRLAREGADLILAAPEENEIDKTADEILNLGRRATAVVTDVSHDAQVKKMADRALADFGRVDILVNNAGIVGPTAPLQEVSRDDWDQVLAVNLTGAFLCTRAVLPGMIQRRSGKIVNIASTAARNVTAMRSPYAASKWGLIGLTMTVAKEVGKHDIHVNAVCPGPVEGGRINKVIAAQAEEQGRAVEQVTQEYVNQTLLGRFVPAEDVAAMVAFLVSDDANHITGQALEVSAGWRM